MNINTPALPLTTSQPEPPTAAEEQTAINPPATSPAPIPTPEATADLSETGPLIDPTISAPQDPPSSAPHKPLVTPLETETAGNLSDTPETEDPTPPKVTPTPPAPDRTPPAPQAGAAPETPTTSELSYTLQLPTPVIANDIDSARELKDEMDARHSEERIPSQNLDPNAATLPTIDYGTVAERYNMDRSIGTISSAKTRAVFDALLYFSDNPQDTRRATTRLLESISELEKEDPELARVFRGKFVNYLFDPKREPGMVPMNAESIPKAKEESRLARFSRATSVGVGTSAVSGAIMEKWGFTIGPKVLHILTRPFGLPWAIVAGIDEVKRKKINYELERRKSSPPQSPQKQLGLPSDLDLSNAGEALNSVMAIQKAQDIAFAVKHAKETIEQLEPINPEAAKALKQIVDDFVNDPSDVLTLLTTDEMTDILDGGSSLENYVAMASGIADSALIWSWIASAEAPILAPVATALTIFSAGAAIYRVSKDAAEKYEKEWAEEEMERRRQLEYHVDKSGTMIKHTENSPLALPTKHQN